MHLGTRIVKNAIIFEIPILSFSHLVQSFALFFEGSVNAN